MYGKKIALIAAAIGISWSLFQLAFNSYLYMEPMMLRSLHVTFALVLVYLHAIVKEKTSRMKTAAFLLTKSLRPIALLHDE